jgi:hypothetical protein
MEKRHICHIGCRADKNGTLSGCSMNAFPVCESIHDNIQWQNTSRPIIAARPGLKVYAWAALGTISDKNVSFYGNLTQLHKIGSS